MSRSKSRPCPNCDNYDIWGNDSQCYACHMADERAELEKKFNVDALNDASTLEELKDWIKEHLIK